MNIKEIAKAAHLSAKEKGFWDDYPDRESRRKSLPEKLALIHSEISEALECHRCGDYTTSVVAGKPEGFWTEMADVIIRILDTAEGLGATDELVDAIIGKMNYNRTRPYKHGKSC